jgi:polyferredoxin
MRQKKKMTGKRFKREKREKREMQMTLFTSKLPLYSNFYLLVIITLFLNNYHLNPLSPPNEKTI